LWDGRPARLERTGGTPIPQTCVNYLIRDPNLRFPLHNKKNKIHRYQQIIADLRLAPLIKLSVPQKPAFVVGCKKESFGNQVSQGDDNNLKFRVPACLESKFGKYLEPKQEISRATLTDYQY
jgi:hypothetical protein